MLAAVLTAVWFFTTRPYAADTLDCTKLWLERPLQITSVRLYRALCNQPAVQWLLVRSKTPTVGRDSFEVDTTRCSTYAIAQVDSHGWESCWKVRTFGIPPVTVPPPPAWGTGDWKAFDPQGRRVRFPLPSGRYFLRLWKEGKLQTRDTVVVH